MCPLEARLRVLICCEQWILNDPLAPSASLGLAASRKRLHRDDRRAGRQSKFTLRIRCGSARPRSLRKGILDHALRSQLAPACGQCALGQYAIAGHATSRRGSQIPFPPAPPEGTDLPAAAAGPLLRSRRTALEGRPPVLRLQARVPACKVAGPSQKLRPQWLPQQTFRIPIPLLQISGAWSFPVTERRSDCPGGHNKVAFLKGLTAAEISLDTPSDLVLKFRMIDHRWAETLKSAVGINQAGLKFPSRNRIDPLGQAFRSAAIVAFRHKLRAV